MAYINPFIKVNAGGIPRLEALSVSMSGNDATYTFHPHRFLDYPYAGLIIFKLPSNSATITTAGNVYFSSGSTSSNKQVNDYSGTSLASNNSALVKGGVFVGWYSDGKLLILNEV